MINFLDDLDAGCRGDGVTTQLAALVIVVPRIEFIRPRGGTVALWDLDRRNLEIILGLAGCVRTQEETVCGVWFGGGSEKMMIIFLNFLEYKAMIRTILCREAIGMSDWASQERE